MNEAERRIAEHDDMIRDLVENDPLFSNFTVIEAETTHGRRLVLVKREEGSGIQMPEPSISVSQTRAIRQLSH
jgi:hypothetical protein